MFIIFLNNSDTAVQIAYTTFTYNTEYVTSIYSFLYLLHLFYNGALSWLPRT